MSKGKGKEKILKTARKNKSHTKRIPMKLSADFSAETLQVRREWHESMIHFKVLKGKPLQPRVVFSQQDYYSELKYTFKKPKKPKQLLKQAKT